MSADVETQPKNKKITKLTQKQAKINRNKSEAQIGSEMSFEEIYDKVAEQNKLISVTKADIAELNKRLSKEYTELYKWKRIALSKRKSKGA